MAMVRFYILLINYGRQVYYRKMQLDIEKSTPASDMTCTFQSRITIENCNNGPVMNFGLAMNFGPVTDGWTNRQKAMQCSLMYSAH